MKVMPGLMAVVILLSASAWASEPAEAVNGAALGLGPVVDQVRQGDVAYLALAEGGVAVVDVSQTPPRLVARLAEGRLVSRLLVQGGVLYLLELRQEATPYTLADPLHPVALRPSLTLPAVPSAEERPQTADAPQRPRAKVVSVTRGRAIFDAGFAEGFTSGEHVRILSQRLVRKPDLTTGGTRDVPSNEVTAVLRVEQADEHRAMAPLGRGDVVIPGDVVELTQAPLSERLFIPARAPFTVRAGFRVQPFLGLDSATVAGSRSKPFGALVDLFATWYLPQVPVALQATAAPVGLALGTVDRHYPMTFAFTGAYATDFFEIGLGAGALVGNAGPCNLALAPASTCEENTGFTVNQELRLGALDGLHLAWHSSIFSRPDRFVFGVGRGELNLPLSSRLGLFASGGGGESGWGFGELGVRTYVGGTGAKGTMIISASLGYAAIFDGPSREMVGGPSVAFGMEWRL